MCDIVGDRAGDDDGFQFASLWDVSPLWSGSHKELRHVLSQLHLLHLRTKPPSMMNSWPLAPSCPASQLTMLAMSSGSP